MPVIQGPTEVPGNSESAWVDTDGQSNIIVGVKGVDYWVQFHLGNTDYVYASDSVLASDSGVLIAKAAAVRVVSRRDESVFFEVFA